MFDQALLNEGITWLEYVITVLQWAVGIVVVVLAYFGLAVVIGHFCAINNRRYRMAVKPKPWRYGEGIRVCGGNGSGYDSDSVDRPAAHREQSKNPRKSESHAK